MMIGKISLVALVALFGSLFLLEEANAGQFGAPQLIAIIDKTQALAVAWNEALTNLQIELAGHTSILSEVFKVRDLLAQHKIQEALSRAVAAALCDEPVGTLSDSSLLSDHANNVLNSLDKDETQQDPHYYGYRRPHYYHKKIGYKKYCYNKCKNVTTVVPKKETLIGIIFDIWQVYFLCFDTLNQLLVSVLTQVPPPLANDTLVIEINILINATRQLLNDLIQLRNGVLALPDTVTVVCQTHCHVKQTTHGGYSRYGGHSRYRYGDAPEKRALLMKKLDLDDEPDYEPNDETNDETNDGPDNERKTAT